MARSTMFGREDRVKGAKLREVERSKRSDKQQLEMLDKVFGKGNGAKKERAKLNKRIGGN